MAVVSRYYHTINEGIYVEEISFDAVIEASFEKNN